MPEITVRQIPIDTQAVQWTGLNIDEMRDFLGVDFAGWRNSDTGVLLLIRTREHRNAPFAAPPGSWVLRGTKGEHWAVDGEVFAERYEPVDRSDDLIAASQFAGLQAHARLLAACDDDGERA